MKTTAEIKIQETQYGYYKPTETFKRGEFGAVFRDYEYTSKATGEVTIDLIYCKDANDKSPVYLGYEPEYCHNCFAGYGHSIEKHNSTVEALKKKP